MGAPDAVIARIAAKRPFNNIVDQISTADRIHNDFRGGLCALSANFVCSAHDYIAVFFVILTKTRETNPAPRPVGALVLRSLRSRRGLRGRANDDLAKHNI